MTGTLIILVILQVARALTVLLSAVCLGRLAHVWRRRHRYVWGQLEATMLQAVAFLVAALGIVAVQGLATHVLAPLVLVSSPLAWVGILLAVRVITAVEKSQR